MKYLLMLALLVTMPALGHEQECRIELEPAGIHTTYCPRGTIVDANSTRINSTGGPRPHLFVYDNVRCVRPVLKCDTLEED